jgi:glycosyltransferase involved in cell wall biosynthesis
MFVTIISITYNAGALLEKTIQSVLNQTCKDYEYLIVDGKSVDNTLDIIRKYSGIFEEKGLSLRWVSEPDKGIYDAMNKGLQLAKGDYIWFVNGGDAISGPDTLASIQESLPVGKNKPDFIYGETLIVNSKGEIMGKRRLKAPGHLTWKSFRMGMLVCHQSMLVSRELAPAYDLTYHYSADFEWTIRCLKKARSIHNTGLILAHFMDGGVSKKKMRNSLKERFRIMSHYYGWLPTTCRHVWFVFRAAWFKVIHGWI